MNIDRFFINDEKTEIVKVIVENDMYNVYIWDIKTINGKSLYHTDDYVKKEVKSFTSLPSRKSVLKYLGDEFREYDPDILDHNDESIPFQLDIGGEGE